MARSFISEPLNLFTGGQGAGKSLFAIEQADLLRCDPKEPAAVFQVNIRDPDTRYLPHLPFDVHELAYKDGEPVRDEQGNHLPRWAVDLPKPCVVIVDEAHKVFPQRGPGRPPRSVEAMAESRYESVRWLLLTQAPGSLDAFLRDRMNVHIHIERKGGLGGATLYEFHNRVVDKQVMAQQKRFADAKSVRKHPKKYFGWYRSAKSHHFRLRLPWKVVLGLLAVPLAAAVAWNLLDTMGGFLDKGLPGQAHAAPVEEPAGERGGARPLAASSEGEGRRLPVQTTALAYLAQFQPLIQTQPWTAPAFQGDELRTRPDLYCISSGVDGADSCRCLTEQGTPYVVEHAACLYIARHGIYNPHRPPVGSASGAAAKREKPSSSASRVQPLDAPPAGPAGGGSGQQVADYGAFRSGV